MYQYQLAQLSMQVLKANIEQIFTAIIYSQVEALASMQNPPIFVIFRISVKLDNSG